MTIIALEFSYLLLCKIKKKEEKSRINTIVFQYQAHEFPFQIYFVKILLSFKLR